MKTKMGKRFMTGILSAALLVSILPASALAEETVSEEILEAEDAEPTVPEEDAELMDETDAADVSDTEAAGEVEEEASVGVDGTEIKVGLDFDSEEAEDVEEAEDMFLGDAVDAAEETGEADSALLSAMDGAVLTEEGGELASGNYYLSEDVQLITNITIPEGGKLPLI